MRMKKLLKAGIKYLKSADYRFLIHSGLGFYNYMSDETYIKRKYSACMGRELNLKDPQTFNEKLQWLKLHDRKPEYTMMVDKYRVREYIADTIGEEYLIPLLGVWADPEDIDFDALPDQFVLKCNHNSGLGMCICKDKSKLDIPKVKRELKKSLKQDYYLAGREWPYKDVQKCIIAEAYMEDEDSDDLRDYKFYCFNGTPKFLYVSESLSDHDKARISFASMGWEKMSVKRSDYATFDTLPKRPKNFELMVEFGKKLSAGIPFLRVDLYEINGAVYFGELTFFPGSGFTSLKPEEWDYRLGQWIDLSQVQ